MKAKKLRGLSVKKKVIILLAIILVLCCIPLKYAYKDGGSISYRAVLYSYTKYHRLRNDGTYYIANKFLFFPNNYLERNITDDEE